MPASGGPYRLQIVDYERTAAGTYEIHVYSLSAATACEVTTLTCGIPMNGQVENWTDLDLYRFSVVDGVTLEFAVVKTGGDYHFAFRGTVEHLRLRLPPFVGVRTIAPNVPFGAGYFLVEASRTPHEAQSLLLAPGASVRVGVRRLHALAHPDLHFLIA